MPFSGNITKVLFITVIETTVVIRASSNENVLKKNIACRPTIQMHLITGAVSSVVSMDTAQTFTRISCLYKTRASNPKFDFLEIWHFLYLSNKSTKLARMFVICISWQKKLHALRTLNWMLRALRYSISDSGGLPLLVGAHAEVVLFSTRWPRKHSLELEVFRNQGNKEVDFLRENFIFFIVSRTSTNRVSNGWHQS